MRVAVVTAMLLVLGVSGALAACVLGDYSTRAEFERSSVVAVVRVVSERPVPDQKEQGRFEGTVYTVRVQETLRGRALRTLSVFSENSSGRFPMEEGQTYIVFLDSQSGQLSADPCGNSGLVSGKEAVVDTVRGLVHAQATEKSDIQARATLLYQAAAGSRWARVKKVADDDDVPFAPLDPKTWERKVEVSMWLKVEYPDGRRETIRHYSDVWILSNGTWYFAANRRGPYSP
jgi:hypothetical protein